MANNRLFLKCKQCGKSIMIGKHLGGALYVDSDFADRLNDFYVKHCYCVDVHYDLELCEEFPGEMTDNSLDVDDIGGLEYVIR